MKIERERENLVGLSGRPWQWWKKAEQSGVRTRVCFGDDYYEREMQN